MESDTPEFSASDTYTDIYFVSPKYTGPLILSIHASICSVSQLLKTYFSCYHYQRQKKLKYEKINQFQQNMEKLPCHRNAKMDTPFYKMRKRVNHRLGLRVGTGNRGSKLWNFSSADFILGTTLFYIDHDSTNDVP